jgi:hypothetical protein
MTSGGMVRGIGVVLSIVAIGCSDGGAASASGVDAGANGSADVPDGGARAARDAGGAPATCDGEDAAVPTSPEALLGWLQGGAYRCWAHESVQHASSGPHGGEVRTFVNGALATSLAGGGSHPRGAASVKELFDATGTSPRGWAVLVKNEPEAAGGAAFYWYEVLGTAPGATRYEGQGSTVCTGCHAGGRDFVLTPYPLR